MILEVNNLMVSYEKAELLHDVTFVLGKGEIVGFICSNGAGKTICIESK